MVDRLALAWKGCSSLLLAILTEGDNNLNVLSHELLKIIKLLGQRDAKYAPLNKDLLRWREGQRERSSFL